jgi:hypothetical protein
MRIREAQKTYGSWNSVLKDTVRNGILFSKENLAEPGSPGSSGLSSQRYQLLCCDLTDPEQLGAQLAARGFHWDRPTLLLSGKAQATPLPSCKVFYFKGTVSQDE